jgi:hypothetical protein
LDFKVAALAAPQERRSRNPQAISDDTDVQLWGIDRYRLGLKRIGEPVQRSRQGLEV